MATHPPTFAGQMIAEQHQKVVEKQAETDRKKAIIEAEKQAAIETIQSEAKVKEKESMQKRASIDNEMHLAAEKARVDAEFYKAEKTAAANKLKLTKEWVPVRQVDRKRRCGLREFPPRPGPTAATPAATDSAPAPRPRIWRSGATCRAHTVVVGTLRLPRTRQLQTTPRSSLGQTYQRFSKVQAQVYAWSSYW